MSKSEKMIQKMRDNPKDWRLASLEAIAKRLDIQVRKSGGSHAVFMHEDSHIVVTVPSKRPIKSIYIYQFLALIDDIGA
ncbi:MAG: type II toxin-antitoxin system HicA family toxin [Sedimenticola sp.]